MDTETLLGLAACLVASVFFSVTDSALGYFSWSGLEELARDHGKRRERLARFLDARRRYQLACFALNSVANVLFVILLTHALLEPPYSGAQVALVLLYSLVFVLVLGEVVPRAWGEGNADRWLYHVFPVVRIAALASWPLTAVLELTNRVVGRIADVPMERPNAVEFGDEIRSVVSEGEKNGALEEEEKEMIASIFELHDIDVAEIMTPRTDMVCIEADASLDELRTLANRCGYSRIPVFEKTRDNILGICHVKDLLAKAHEAGLSARDVAQPPHFVPETKRVHELLQELRSLKIHMAVVLDEYGGTAGIVTLEDIVEEIVGEIVDEYDQEPSEPMVTLDERTVECAGRLPIDDLNDGLHIDIPEDESYDTVSGFVASQLGHIPAKGETCRWRNVDFTVLEATDRRIRRLRVAVHPEHADPSSQ
ncbi:MAG: hemolysin family protein [Candidatus Brocadiia bacterium]